MAVSQAGSEGRTPRPGSVERPINGRLYRTSALLVPIALVVAAFTVSQPAALPAPSLPPVYDGRAAFALANELARRFPDRSPGTPGAEGATAWVSSRLAELGLAVERDSFEADVTGRGRVRLTNLYAVVPGRSQEAIVLLAHRDNLGAGPGADDNASGTATLVELARAQVAPRREQTTGRLVLPLHTLVFVSTDGGAFGGLGADRFAESSRFDGRIRAAVNLAAVGGAGRPHLHAVGDTPRSPPPVFLRTARARVREHTGQEPERVGAVRQILDLAFPLSLYEHAPLVARGVPAFTLSRAPERPPSPFGDVPDKLDERRLGAIGRSVQALVASLDPGSDFGDAPSSYVQFGPRIVPGWALTVVAGAALVPVILTVVDLLARSRRRRVGLVAPARAYLRRLVFWLAAAAVFVLLGGIGLWHEGAARPLSPETDAAQDWPAPQLFLYALLVIAAWLLARRRLLRRGLVGPKEELGGYTVALVVLCAVGIAAFVQNPFALVFVLPSLHAWLWLPQLRARSALVRWAILAVGFLGPLLLVGSVAARFELGLDTPWYLAQLAAVGYVPPAAVALALVWAAAAAQLTALVARRYAPYPSHEERRRAPNVVRLALAAAHDTIGARHPRAQ